MTAETPTTSPRLVLRKVDFAALGDDDHVQYLAFQNRLRAESLPDDPPRTLEAHLARRRSIPPFVEEHNWEVRDTGVAGAPIVGFGELYVTHLEENKHIASFYIKVLPEWRREGIARQLLHPIVVVAQEKARTVLMTDTNDRAPAGEPFLRRLGAEPGLHSHTNQLALAEADQTAIKRYREESEKRCGGDFELIFCQSPLPDELLVPAVALGNMVARDIPMGDLGMEIEQYTPEQMREMDRTGMASGATMMAMIARDRGTGAFVALTTMTWHRHTPEIAEQGITGVLPEYRGRGLARYIKVAMLERLMNDYPQVQFVRTDNADSNAAMLAVNTALGFRPYRSETRWQVSVERVLAYLAG